MIAKKLTIVMAAALVVAGAATARADEASPSSPYAGKSVYASAGAVYGVENVSGVPGGVDNGWGYDLRLGYNLHDMFAVEGEWQSLLSLARHTSDPITGNPDPNLEARMLSLNGRFSPLTGRIQPYALMGMGWFNVQADKVANTLHESSFAMRFGLGVATYITERTGVALEAAYILPLTGSLGGGDSFDLIPITASVFFRFK